MLFIGDNHGAFPTYLHVLFKMQHKRGRKGVDCSLQLGDMGIGFWDKGEFSKDGKKWSPEIDLNHKFIRGNHDDPGLCRQHLNYLGEWGFLSAPNIFHVSGGFSIDWQSRIPGMTWWKDEELNKEEMEKVLIDYELNKPKIVVSHECPLEIKKDVVTNKWKLEVDSRTETLLQAMFEIHQPDEWIFGHHHQYKEIDKNGTHFVCLDELLDGKVSDCIYEIHGLTWEG